MGCEVIEKLATALARVVRIVVSRSHGRHTEQQEVLRKTCLRSFVCCWGKYKTKASGSTGGEVGEVAR